MFSRYTIRPRKPREISALKITHANYADAQDWIEENLADHRGVKRVNPSRRRMRTGVPVAVFGIGDTGPNRKVVVPIPGYLVEEVTADGTVIYYGARVEAFDEEWQPVED
ncbi:hypothetical protein AB0I72_00580 [Nocardiopsis sp. NPDC049922]|uniref:hypothetical protein n=1 Tax=Nocardiopsis sp. NPDC049922 TaxID=3155157 RepID=UPI00340C035E